MKSNFDENISFDISDLKQIDEILNRLKDEDRFELEPENCSKEYFAQYMLYAKQISECGYLRKSHIKEYGISLYGLNSHGLAFLEKGGFSVIEDNKLKEEYRRTKDKEREYRHHRRDRLIDAFIGFIVGAIVVKSIDFILEWL